MDHQKNIRIGEELIFRIYPYHLHFKVPARTSRDVLNSRIIWYICVQSKANPGMMGIGECAPIAGLSADPMDQLKNLMSQNNPIFTQEHFALFPSLKFAVETALRDMEEGGRQILFDNDFTAGKKNIPINGLVWMSDADDMLDQAEEKIRNGFNCVKIKIGALDKESELSLIRHLRTKHPEVILRVDANGGLSRWKDADKKIADTGYAISFMAELAKLGVHSIEQPILANEEVYSELCAQTPLPIALDEQLIGIKTLLEKKQLLENIRPQYIILKPTLLGGIGNCEEWIGLAKTTGTGWWITSALESNIGLNAIAQWTASLGTELHQGLGTGQLYTNNIESPLAIDGGQLSFNPEKRFEINGIFGA